MEKILLFQVKPEEVRKIKQLAAAKKIKTLVLRQGAVTCTLKELADKKEPPDKKEEPEGQNIRPASAASLLVFCDVSEKHFNKLLFEMKNKNVRVDYKAVLTPSNREWTLKRLLMELEGEAEALNKPASI